MAMSYWPKQPRPAKLRLKMPFASAWCDCRVELLASAGSLATATRTISASSMAASDSSGDDDDGDFDDFADWATGALL